jgi:hypothetical protein
MHNMMTVDTLRELAAQDERRQVAVLGLGAAILQQQQILLAALATKDVKGATEQKVNPETVVRRRA